MGSMSTLDYKWRKRICHKWQEEVRQQQQQQLKLEQQQPHQMPPPPARNLGNFMADPMNLQKLFLPRRTLQLLAPRPDFQRLVRMCFVRVRFAAGHRVAQILGCGKWPHFILRIDPSPRMFAIGQLDNGYFERDELLEWEYMWRAYNFELPSKRTVEQKHTAILEAKQTQKHKLAKSKCCGLLLHDFQAKYLVEPMDCYKPYLPTAITNCPQPLKPPLDGAVKQPQHLNGARKKISLDEYRERCIKKNN